MFKTEVTMKNPPPNPNFTRLVAVIAACLKAAGIAVEAATIKNFSLKLQGNWKPDHNWEPTHDSNDRGSRSMICKLMLEQVPTGAYVASDEHINIYGISSHVDYNAKLHIPVKDAEYAMIMEACKPPVTTGIPTIDSELGGVRVGEQTIIAAPGQPYTPTQVIDMLRSILQKWTAAQIEEFRTLLPDVMPLYSKARLQEAANEQAADRIPLHGFQLTADAATRYPHWASWVKDIMVAFHKDVAGEPLLKVMYGKSALTVCVDQWLIEFSDKTYEVMSHADFVEFAKKFELPPLLAGIATASPDTRQEVEAFQLTKASLQIRRTWPKWLMDSIVDQWLIEFSDIDTVNMVVRTADGEQYVYFNEWLVRDPNSNMVKICGQPYFDKHFKLKPTTQPQLLDVDAVRLTREFICDGRQWPAWLNSATIKLDGSGGIALFSVAGGDKAAAFDDWVIYCGDGVLDVCKPDIFEKFYRVKPPTTETTYI